MAKTSGPLLSLGATGSIADSITFGSWRGVSYARQKVTPANPRTAAQQANRTRFALLREMFKLAPAVLRAPWTAFASGRKFTDMNAFVGENNRVLNGALDFAGFLGSPGARGGLPPLSVSAADGGDNTSVDVTVTAPDQIPDGWMIVGVAAVAFIDQDPTGIFSGPLKADSVDAPATTVNLTGFAPADEVRVSGWVIYEKPNGTLAYSVGLTDVVTIL